MPAIWNGTLSTARSEAVHHRSRPAAGRSRSASIPARGGCGSGSTRQPRAAAADLPAASSRRAALDWAVGAARLGRTAARRSRAGQVRSCPGAIIPVRRPRDAGSTGSKAARGRWPARRRCPGLRRSARRLRPADRSLAQARARATCCRPTPPTVARTAGVSVSGSASAMPAPRWGSCSASGSDPLQLAADPGAAGSPPLGRGA